MANLYRIGIVSSGLYYKKIDIFVFKKKLNYGLFFDANLSIVVSQVVQNDSMVTIGLEKLLDVLFIEKLDKWRNGITELAQLFDNVVTLFNEVLKELKA